MPIKGTYRLRMGSKVYTGSIEDVARISGYTKSTVQTIVTGRFTPEGITIERIDEPEVRQKLPDDKIQEWDEAVAKFKNVEWVKHKGEGVLVLKVKK